MATLALDAMLRLPPTAACVEDLKKCAAIVFQTVGPM